MKHLNATLRELEQAKTVENVFVRVGKWDKVLYDAKCGKVDKNTLFDMASVTKIMATTSLALLALDKGLLSFENTLKDFYPESTKNITVLNMLTHTVGIGYKSLNKEGNTYENILSFIDGIPSDCEIGERVIYSCPGFIMLGKVLEKVYGKRLDEAFDEYVAKPLGLKNTSFLPENKKNCVNANLEENLRGVVNDYNCQFLGGVAGNAGLFSNATDVTAYAQFLLRRGKPILSEKIFEKAVKNYTEDKEESRGLGFLYVDNRYSQTGGLFKDGAIGHCGHTGQSVFADYRTGLYVIILSDATVSTIKKYGQENYGEVMNMREKIHGAIKKDLKM